VFYLILSTIHSAKGQEWKSVYVLNVVDGCMPSDLGAGTSAELEEEHAIIGFHDCGNPLCRSIAA
jgi:DNA helicase-2/ATP-dependent DNA helicase PcrA